MHPSNEIVPNLFTEDMDNPNLMRESLFETLESQMRDGTPPEAKISYDRLISLGFDSEEVMRRMACVLMAEIHDMMKTKRNFDTDGYTANLRALPNLPDGVE